MIRFGTGCLFIAALFTAFAQTPEYRFQVVHVYPHDPNAFTEGLEYRAGFLYESTGLKGRSWLRKEKLETGQVLQQIDLASQYFGEGITILNQQIFQLTWQTETGFVYDQASFRMKRTFNYPGEGWALTNDGQNIYMDDGTAQIRVWDPYTLQEKRRITVKDQGQPVTNLNELEWVRGEIYANIWQTDRIARISPMDGRVLGWIDCTGLLSPADQTGGDGAVLNGIAYDSFGDRLFVTGKLWPKLFEIKLVKRVQRKKR
ncbi:MAG TPA: glutaminyl-peptide cyclotransferase [Bryobacteraceae bacterium]|nr:glutaminyl-peptide cyclotransferase [Bryobacteraceae bacterium]